VHGKPLLGGTQGRPFGDSPGDERAVHLEPEIVMQARGVVPLNTIEISCGSYFRSFGSRLGCLGEGPLTRVFFERHGKTFLGKTFLLLQDIRNS